MTFQPTEGIGDHKKPVGAAGYNDPGWLTKRHGLSGVDTPIGNLTAALKAVTKAAAAG